jgi:hypothetical protein
MRSRRKKAQERIADQQGERNATEESSCAMARLAWMESEVGSAAGFPNESIILQKV